MILEIEILKLRKLNKTYNEIQKALGCSKGLISYYCNESQREKVQSRRRKNRKIQLISLKKLHGGQCSICKYDKCLEALDFHHKNPSNKIDGVAKLLTKQSFLAAKKEAEKCILVCANCHREIHAQFKMAQPTEVASVLIL